MSAASLFAAYFAVIAHCACANTIQGKVVAIADGDTVTVLDQSNQQHKIRLEGIDAPEKAQPFGQRSKEHLSSLVFDRQVTTECGKRDKYRREVCKILIDGLDANLEQVKAGIVWWYRAYAKEQSAEDRAIYGAAEKEAIEARVGLWRDTAPVAPWAWRHWGK